MYNIDISPSEQDIANASQSELLEYYAAGASVNPNLEFPSVPPGMEQVYKKTLDNNGRFAASMMISHFQGILQGFFVGLVGAKRILEIGTLTGSSAIYFTHALKRNGVGSGPYSNEEMPVTSLEISEEYARQARENFAAASVSNYINVIVGDAHEELVKLDGQQFDLIFIDADKNSYKAYYDIIIDRGLLHKNGLLIIDKTALWKVTEFIGKPTDEEATAEIIKIPFLESTHEQVGRVLHDFNEHIRADPRTEVIMFPIFTGMSFVRLLN
ncbi:hypothetical protein LPJ53_000297 [Coemansia erecta]|uniref:O-methyltransferase n=1 Tax=Coemansia erecta TaxID=147472 RepID=A0A9W7Y6K8_9FUNG|nr:hypothetical protein LPJ53_000297 [Coemansia erecta]